MSQLISTIVGVVVAVGASAALFIGANKWFDQTRDSWRRFGALTGGVVGLVFTLILVANRALAWLPAGSGGTDLTWWLLPLMALLVGVWGFLITGTGEGIARLAIGAGGGLLIGLVYGVFLRSDAFPAMQIVPLLLWPVIGAAVFAGLSALRQTPWLHGAITGATVGWVIGAFLVPDLGPGTRAEAMMGLGLAWAGLGLRVAVADPLTYEERQDLYRRSRAVIFVAPALAFIAWSLVIPTLRTIWLSFQGPNAQELVGFRNYGAIFSDPGIWDLSGWPGIFTSSLFYWGLALVILGVIAGIISGRRSRQPFERNGASLTPMAAGIFLFAFAVFANLRGTIFNNLWWVFTVTILATSLGLAIAVLADRSRAESVAKSLIFMPMAISFVGAAIIWRFMYIPRPPQAEQTGVFNALWVGLGRLSTGDGRFVAAFLLGLVVALLLFLAWRGYRAEANGLAITGAVLTLPVLWLIYRFLGPGIGGFTVGPNGDIIPQTVLFLQEIPWNNLFLMIPFLWIYTGFAMVIFSAAIKAVPADLIEASRVDGATESQTFWRVTIPQIAPTIGVVVTTLIVVVMKVFDIVKVMTNGNFDTQVLANEMWQRAFTELNFGLGAALAVLLFVSVVPIMYLNIRKMQREAV